MKNIDLGKYDLNQLLRNPGIIHQIQDNLMAIEGDNLLQITIRDGAKADIKQCIKMIITQYKHNPLIMLGVVGKDTLELIEEFEGITL